jgi:hypothetical protein
VVEEAKKYKGRLLDATTAEEILTEIVENP